MNFNFFTFLMLAALTFTACHKNDLKKEEEKEFYKHEGEKDGDEKYEGKKECFKLVYPITYIMPDGTKITGNDEEKIGEAMKAWYEAHPDSKEEPSLHCPVEIIFENGTTKSVANEEELEKLEKDCYGKDEMKVCEWDGSKVSDLAIWEEHIVEPIVTNDDCGGCIVEGVVKYVKIGTDFAYVIYYGKGECDEWAYLVTYYGKDEDKAEKCKIELDCDSGN